MRRKVFSILFLMVVLWPVGGVGAVDLKPQFNPICWKQADCATTRAIFGADKTTAGDGWLEEDPCKGGTEKYGKCLPAGKTVTSIKFGGKTDFVDLGEFFKLNYNYLLGIAGILSVFMIIIGAAQYVTSGGSSEAIGSAKKRIAGALVGLLIAYLSYVILTTINPALTNLRLPQVFMIKSQKLVPQFCSQMPADTMFAKVGEPNQKVDLEKIGEVPYNKPYKREDFKCGAQYIPDGAGRNSCLGDYCDPGNVCSPVKLVGGSGGSIENGSSGCVKGQLMVHLRMDSMFEKVVKGIPIVPNIENADWLDPGGTVFWGVCKSPDGTIKAGNKYEQWDGGSEQRDIYFDKKTFWEYYLVLGGLDTAHGLDHWSCNDDAKLVGFLLKTEVGLNWESSDANMMIAQTVGGKGWLGSWKKMDVYTYLKWDKMQNGGLVIDASLTDDALDDIIENVGDDPDNEEYLGKESP